MVEPLGNLAGVITGAASGIGAATAQELARLGASLVLTDLEEDRLAPVVEQLGERGRRSVAVPADVRRFDQLERVRDACIEEFGRIDFVVANAGIAEAGPLAEGDPERWRLVVETNVLGAAFTVRAMLPTMLRQDRGHIVLMASISGLETYPGEGIYIASKWAVVGLGRTLRRELAGSRVRVTLVEPGLVDTPLARANPFAQDWLSRFEPLRADDIARSVAFALTQPDHVGLNEIVLRPNSQEV